MRLSKCVVVYTLRKHSGFGRTFIHSLSDCNNLYGLRGIAV